MSKNAKVATTAERIREAMFASNKKQADLVRETGLDRGAISSYLSGKYEPKQKAIGLLSISLDVNEMWLWGYDVPKERGNRGSKEPVGIDELSKKKLDFINKVKQMSEEELERLDQILRIVESTK